jgi:hypothetical protein
MAIVKAVVSIYRTGEEKPIERYKARIQIGEDHKAGIALLAWLGWGSELNGK